MFKSTIIAAGFALAFSGAAFAQTQSNQSGGNQGGGNQGQQEGLVNVQLGDVIIDELASNLNVNVSDIPVTVQVPVAAAVNICGVDANVLAEQRKGGGDVECDATSNSEALTQVVQQQMGG